VHPPRDTPLSMFGRRKSSACAGKDRAQRRILRVGEAGASRYTRRRFDQSPHLDPGRPPARAAIDPEVMILSVHTSRASERTGTAHTSRLWALALFASLTLAGYPAQLGLAHAAPTAPAPQKTGTKPAAKPAATAPARPAGAAAANANPARAAGNVSALDAIAAMVNDEPVLASDVEEQLFLFLQRTQSHPDSSQVDTLRRQVLDQLIDEKLVLAEAKRQNVTVAPAEVAKQVEGAISEARERFGGDAGFREQLQRENTTEARLRERYKADAERQMLEERVVRKMFPKKSVPPAEAQAWFLAHRDKFPKVPAQLHLQVLQITPSPDSGSLAAGKSKIDAIRKRILAGEKFAKVSAEASDDPGTAKSGGDLGFFRRGQMEPALEDVAFSLAPGKLSAPLRSPYGWHLVEAMERDTVRGPNGADSLGADGKPIVEVHARHILVKVTPDDSDVDRAYELTKKVREQAAKGGDFAALVKRYSTYRGPATAEGDVGFLSVAQLQPNIRAGLEPLKLGEVSDVLPNPQGFNIFKLLERKPERDYEVAEIKDELPDAVADAQFREKYEAWLKTLRSKAQIEYRDL
jgi:peptidyl-prolyl cis-trans isomerase SurA